MLLSFAPTASAQVLYTLDNDAATLRTVDATTGATLAPRTVVMGGGLTYLRGLALTYRATDFSLFMVVDTEAGSVLARTVPGLCSMTTCDASVVGVLPSSSDFRFTGLAFDCGAPPVLYGITGASGLANGRQPNGGIVAHAVYVIDPATASVGNLVISLADGTDGPEEIATIVGTPGIAYRYGGELIESFGRIDVAVPSFVEIPISNGSVPSVGGLAYATSLDAFIASTGSTLRRISLTGSVATGAALDHVPGGLTPVGQSCTVSIFANGFE